jgi:hypothetical protein
MLMPPASNPRSYSHLQALDDAIRYRQARLRRSCRSCLPGALCDPHGRDNSLLEAYHEMAQAVVAVIQEQEGRVPTRPAGEQADHGVSATGSGADG